MTARNLTLELNSIKNEDEIDKLIQSFKLNSQEAIKTVIKENYNKIKLIRNNFVNNKPRKTNQYIELLDSLAMYEQKCTLNYNEELEILLEILDIYRANPSFMIKTDVFIRLGSVYNRLGEYQYEKYCYKEAEEYYKYLFDDYKPNLPENLSIFDDISKRLTRVYKHLLDEYHGNAKEFYEEALGVYEKFLPKNHIAIAEILNGLAKVYDNIGEHSKKEDYYKKAIHYYEQAFETFNETPLENDLFIADTRNNMGAVYYELNDYAKSKEMNEISLEIYRNMLIENHFYVADTYNNLGTVCYQLNDFDNAKIFYEKALDIYRKVSSKNQSLMNDIFIRLGRVYNCLGEYENENYCYKEAEEYYQFYKILYDIYKNKLPENISIFDDICKVLSFVYKGLPSDNDKAKEFCEEALGIYEKFLPNKQPFIQSLRESRKEVDCSMEKNVCLKNTFTNPTAP